MASPVSVVDLKEDALCPLCKQYLTDPVLVDCDHNFCRICISDYYVSKKEKNEPLQCPVCSSPIQEGKLRPNQQLGSIVEKLKKLPALKVGKDYVCPKHKEKLNLFCEDDEELVCLICERSPEHASHIVHLAEQAVEKYKIQMRVRLVKLKQLKEEMGTIPRDAEKETFDMLKMVEKEKEKAAAEFKNFHGFLDEQQNLLLTQMQELQKEVARKRKHYVSSLSEEMTSLTKLIAEIQETCEQPATEFLMDFKQNFQRCDTACQDSVSFPLELKWKLWEFCDTNLLLDAISRRYRDALISGLKSQEEKITLEPSTAHPQLILSEGNRSVRMGEIYKKFPRSPERFDEWPFVLGYEGFTEGRHFWEVTVGNEDTWGIGVAKNSVQRKGDINFSPEGGFWAVGKWEGNYTAYNPPFYTLMTLHKEPKRIRVFLNCDGGWVSFFDADTASPLFSYSAASFFGETLFPFFYVFGKARLSLVTSES
ncbi:tripartite motif-containing protein 10 [Anolis carolinensis]|uniref:tripartite motif-containing protein 10 n=1 Tax=Anolis carolinensis TaxID=28377 RepID=UPI002F2B7B7C